MASADDKPKDMTYRTATALFSDSSSDSEIDDDASLAKKAEAAVKDPSDLADLFGSFSVADKGESKVEKQERKPVASTSSFIPPKPQFAPPKTPSLNRTITSQTPATSKLARPPLNPHQTPFKTPAANRYNQPLGTRTPFMGRPTPRTSLFGIPQVVASPKPPSSVNNRVPVPRTDDYRDAEVISALKIPKPRAYGGNNFFSERYQYNPSDHQGRPRLPVPTAPLRFMNSFISTPRKRTQKGAVDDLVSLVDQLNISTENLEDVDTPTRLNVTLLPHQKQGLKWLIDQEKGCHHGGILADDMGLGKTVQTLALVLSNPSTGTEKTTLIVSPKPLMNQWFKEIKKRCRDVSVLIYHGPARLQMKGLQQQEIVLTTYDVLYEDHKKPKENGFFDISWYRVVLDEAHIIRDASTGRAKACFALKAENRICLTGTPVQNKVDDLHSLFRFLQIDPLSDQGYYKENIIKAFKTDADAAMQKLKKYLQVTLLRRTKTALGALADSGMSLPPKDIKIEKLDFVNESERELYMRIENKYRSRIQFAQDNEQTSNLLTMLMRLRQICDHPYLLSTSASSADLLKEQVTQEGGVEFDSKEKVDEEILTVEKADGGHFEAAHESTKVKRIMEILKEAKERDPGSKTVVFSVFVSMLDAIEHHVKKEAYRYARYDGSLSHKKREEQLSGFLDDPKVTVLLISFHTGSYGLNLTCANRLILVEMWWNPAVEDQAIDRVHRIGQTKPVEIYKLMLNKTIEERILRLQENKRKLIQGVLEGGNLNLKKGLDKNELMQLFNL